MVLYFSFNSLSSTHHYVARYVENSYTCLKAHASVDVIHAHYCVCAAGDAINPVFQI